jgi:hypothetical protein
MMNSNEENINITNTINKETHIDYLEELGQGGNHSQDKNVLSPSDDILKTQTKKNNHDKPPSVGEFIGQSGGWRHKLNHHSYHL